MIVTVPVDELKPGDQIRLLGDCKVVEVEQYPDKRRKVMVKHGRRMTSVWLWKYSRIELLSDLNGRGHLATPVTIDE